MAGENSTWCVNDGIIFINNDKEFTIKGKKPGKFQSLKRVEGGNIQFLFSDRTVARLNESNFLETESLQLKDIPVMRPKRKTRKEGPERQGPKKTKRILPDQLGETDASIASKLIGIHEVQLEKIGAFDPAFSLRDVHDAWVQSIENSLRKLPATTSTIVPVMFIDDRTHFDSEQLKTGDIIPLGARHLIQALKNIVQKNLNPHPQRTVLCRIYKQLSVTEALRVASLHNESQARHKDVLFQSVGSPSVLLATAQFSETQWGLFEKIAKEYTERNESLPQKLFRILQGTANDIQTQCLELALKEGLSKATTHALQIKQLEKLRKMVKKLNSDPDLDIQQCDLTEFLDLDLTSSASADILKSFLEGKRNGENILLDRIDTKIECHFDNKDISSKKCIQEILQKYKNLVTQDLRRLFLQKPNILVETSAVEE